MDKSVQCETLTDSGEAGTGNLPEVELIRRAQQGDAAAFEHLYRVHSGRVNAVCLRMMNGNTFEAEDLTQEAFLQTFRKIGTFRGESAFSTWLHRLTTNIVLMRLRRKKIAAIPLEDSNDPDEETRGVCKEIGATDPRLAGLVDRMNLRARSIFFQPGIDQSSYCVTSLAMNTTKSPKFWNAQPAIRSRNYTRPGHCSAGY